VGPVRSDPVYPKSLEPNVQLVGTYKVAALTCALIKLLLPTWQQVVLEVGYEVEKWGDSLVTSVAPRV